MLEQATLPLHGRITCRKCFTTDREIEEIGLWQAVNDPGAWGSDRPSVLVLGFSKGFTQANAYRRDAFEAIPFKGDVMRARLTAALRPSECYRKLRMSIRNSQPRNVSSRSDHL